MASYTYDVPAGGIAIDRLTLEIQQSAVTVALQSIEVSEGNCTINFKAALSGAEQVVLSGLVSAHSGQALPEPVNENGIPLVALAGSDNRVQAASRQGDEVIRATHNFCDPTTWYQTSERVSNEVLSTSDPDELTWTSVHKNWIAIDQGLLLREHELIARQRTANPGDPHGWLPKIVVGGVTQKRRPPHLTDWTGAGANYDYYIDYTQGQVIFRTAPASAPQASYSYATSSDWHLCPEPGQKLGVEAAEVQWSSDVELTGEIIQESQVAIVPTPDQNNPAHWMTVERLTFKSFWQVSDEARGAFPKQGPVGGTPVWRGTNDTTIEHAPMLYTTIKSIPSSVNARLRVYIGHVWYDENDDIQTEVITPDDVNGGGGFGGTRATATFYSVSEAE